VVPDVEMSDDASILSDDTVIPGIHGMGRQPALTGCPWHDVNEMLQAAGLRPTRQRMALGWLLFGKGARHLTAEMLYEEATLAKVPVSLATVYNTLNQLTDAGLLRQVSVDGTKTYFDTNGSASGAEQDAGSARGLRDRPRRHGRAAAQEALSRTRASINLHEMLFRKWMGCRVKPGNDKCYSVWLPDITSNPPSRRRRRPTAVAVRSSHRSRCR